jgi:general secretion pathway protein J
MTRRLHNAGHPEPASDRQHGFTLIELLVSLTILAVILGLLAGGLRVISQNWDANAKRIETLDMLLRAADILRRDAAGLQRVVAVGAGGAPTYVFSGSQDHLSFVTLEPPYPSTAGPYFVDYSLARNGADLELIRARALYSKDMQIFPGATPANRVRLVQGPYRYEFAYAERSAGAGRWQETWPSVKRLPDLIRLQVIDVRSNRPVGAAAVVAVRADAELGCLLEKPKACSAQSAGQLASQAQNTGYGNEGGRENEGGQK